MPRDPLAEIESSHRAMARADRLVRPEGGGDDLTAEALARKAEALARSPFSFFRGTFFVMARDLLQARVQHGAPLAPEGLVVGDLHLENFGAFRGASGRSVFDVNDFDEVGWAPIDLDLKRLCTSALLLPSLPQRARLGLARAAAEAWAAGITRLGGRFPIAPWDREHADGLVERLLEESEEAAEDALLEKLAPGRRHDAFAQEGAPRKLCRPEARWRRTVGRAVEGWASSLAALKAELPGDWALLDVAYRFKGAGSLGRLRFDALIGRRGERRLLELKEARPSALDEARGAVPEVARARVQTAAIRRLQGDPWPRVASTSLGARSALGRELESGEEKLDTEALVEAGREAPAKLRSYARQCGEVLARLHARANAPLLLNARWSPEEAAAAAVEFAVGYAAVVEADHARFVSSRAR